DDINIPIGALVAQVSNLLYRRASSLRRVGITLRVSRILGMPIGNRRHSRLETCATRSELLQRNIRMTVLIIMQNRMTLAESSTSAVLAAQSNAKSFRAEGGKCQSLCCRPIQRLLSACHFAS